MTTASYISNDTKLSVSNRIGCSEEKTAVEYSSYKSCTSNVSGNNLNYPQCSSSGNNSSIMNRNFEWVCTAAQAAMALQVHGFLNATGMSSYSIRLQHASLPDLDYHQRYCGEHHPYSQQPSSSGSTNWGPAYNMTFVESTLDDDYPPSKLPSSHRPYLSVEKEVTTIDTIRSTFRLPTPSGLQSVQKDNIFNSENKMISDSIP